VNHNVTELDTSKRLQLHLGSMHRSYNFYYLRSLLEGTQNLELMRLKQTHLLRVGWNCNVLGAVLPGLNWPLDCDVTNFASPLQQSRVNMAVVHDYDMMRRRKATATSSA
jgi:hypothetical protein